MCKIIPWNTIISFVELMINLQRKQFQPVIGKKQRAMYCYPWSKIDDADCYPLDWDRWCHVYYHRANSVRFPSYILGRRNYWKIPWKMSKWFSYTASFKWKVIKYAKKHSNRAAERLSGPPPPESVSRLWRQQEEKLLQMPRQKKAMWGKPPKWPEVEQDSEVRTWILEQH